MRQLHNRLGGLGLPTTKDGKSMKTVKKEKMNAKMQSAWKERNKLRAEGNKLRAEGDRLWAEGDIIFLTALLAVYGNIGLTWRHWNVEHNSYECHLANGEVYGFDKNADG